MARGPLALKAPPDSPTVRGPRPPRHESHRVRRCAPRPTLRRRAGVQLGERLEPALLAGGRQVLGEPLADLESRPSVGLVVELDSHPRLERLEAPRQLATRSEEHTS